MAISKIILNGVTQMDVTGKTVTAGDMLSGVTALKNDGTDITGNIANMTLPSASSPTSSGTSKATITPTSSAQYLNIPAGYLDTAQYYTIAAASGGASNIVTGTFKGTTTGSMNVTLNYSGSGYPIAVLVYPDGGPTGNSAYNSLIQRYAMQLWVAVKSDPSTAPNYDTYDDPVNYTVVLRSYKSNTSSSTIYAAASSQNSTYTYRSGEAVASGSGVGVCRFHSSTEMAVYIATSSNCFPVNIEYRYWIIYSS